MQPVHTTTSLLAAIAAGTVATPVVAQPRITELCRDGDDVVIRGDALPSREDIEPLFFDDFDDGRPSDAVEERPGWTIGAETPHLSRDRSISGELSGVAGLPAHGSWVQAYVETDHLMEVYQSSWIFVEEGGEPPTSNSLKIMRINSNGVFYRGSPSLSYSSLPRSGGDRNCLYSLHGSDADGGTYEYDYGRDLAYGRWVRTELYFRLSQPAGAANGLAMAWLDRAAQPVLEGERVTRDAGETTGITSVGFWLGWARRPEGARIYVDDTYVGATRARVELGDGPSFDYVDGRMLQPATAEDGTLRFTPRFGPLDPTAPLHVFVLDVEGGASAGAPLHDAAACSDPAPDPRDAGAPSSDGGAPGRDASTPAPPAGSDAGARTPAERDDGASEGSRSGGCAAALAGRGTAGLLPALVLLAVLALSRTSTRCRTRRRLAAGVLLHVVHRDRSERHRVLQTGLKGRLRRA